MVFIDFNEVCSIAKIGTDLTVKKERFTFMKIKNFQNVPLRGQSSITQRPGDHQMISDPAQYPRNQHENEEPCSTCDLNAQAKLSFTWEIPGMAKCEDHLKAVYTFATYIDVLQPSPSQQSHEFTWKTPTPIRTKDPC
ncbi:14556_t:CDS:2 [Cetraspora pellucida]|uniref:14556_t:CDS:1 n=1 Tax=Cetraspora pellucida TaxID=1433469 RepID=A0ACA9LHM5_9GLOM|nr:14556_t:CDS:2 [Cetraspora pellucida]